MQQTYKNQVYVTTFIIYNLKQEVITNFNRLK